jgi:hypothetical protein
VYPLITYKEKANPYIGKNSLPLIISYFLRGVFAVFDSFVLSLFFAGVAALLLLLLLRLEDFATVVVDFSDLRLDETLFPAGGFDADLLVTVVDDLRDVLAFCPDVGLVADPFFVLLDIRRVGALLLPVPFDCLL